MSYTSENILSEEILLKDVITFLELLDYEYSYSRKHNEIGLIRNYYWFDSKDYKSWSGVELSIYKNQNLIHVDTRTSAGRSFYDLEHQNKTMKLLRKYFKGTFRSDFGKGRYLKQDSGPPEHSASGCHLAFSDFGSNLIRAMRYYKSRSFGKQYEESTGIYWMDRHNPKFISNILILPFICSIAEDYWKSTYIAILKYSGNKEAILKSNRISSERLTLISNNNLSVEEAFAESISFGRISMVCKHFKAIDKEIDFARILRKPYRRRKKTIFDSLEEMTEIRNEIIHRASAPIFIEDDQIKDSINLLHDGIERSYKELTKLKNWEFRKMWGGRI